MNLGFAPEPWLRWQAETLGSGMPKQVSESLGLYRERLHPEGTPRGSDGWWELFDEDSAHAAVADMCVQLDRSGWPALDQMFLARDSFVTPQSMADMLRLLEQRGLVRRTHNPANRRELLVHITEAGHALLRSHAAAAAAIEQRMLAGCRRQRSRSSAGTLTEAWQRLR